MSKAVKIVVMGLAAVGKSALSIRFIQNSFVVDYEPTISNNYTKPMTIDHETYSLDILDTAGMEGGETLKPAIFRGRDCFMLVYDITDRSSFENISQIHEDILRIRDASKVPCCLIGNKSDLESDREVKKDEGEALAKELNAVFIETSARTGQNVNEAVELTVREYLKTIPKQQTKKFCLLI